MAVPLIGNTRCSHLLGCLQLGVANTASCLVSHVAKSALDYAAADGIVFVYWQLNNTARALTAGSVWEGPHSTC
jgi:hypothetical protein